MKAIKTRIKRMVARLMALTLTVGLFHMVPEGGINAYAAEGSTPSVTTFATLQELMTVFDLDGTEDTVGKLAFGKDSGGDTMEWYIVGKDSGVSGDNLIIFAAEPLATGPAYEDTKTTNKTDSTLWSDCVYSEEVDISEVYPTHYGASDLRAALKGMLTDDEGNAVTTYFTVAEQSLMQATAVTTIDMLNDNISYTTCDKLYALHAVYDEAKIYAGSDNSKEIAANPYWNSGVDFWLRPPIGVVGTQSLYAETSAGRVWNWEVDSSWLVVRPASNLNLSSVIFASAATAASSGEVSIGTIAEGTAMTLRLYGSEKNIGKVMYDADSGLIQVEKAASTNGTVALVVQGKDGSNDWYYSKTITGTELISKENIITAASAQGVVLSDISLSDCKIWMETSEDGVVYANMATAGIFVDAVDTTIYVSSASGDDSYEGTQSAPVKTIEQALELAGENATIQIIDSASTQQLSTDEPLCITKAVTITGGSLTLNRGGIVLGTNAIFKDISINMANPVRNAIIANGHTLTLENVKGTGTYPVHLFCGDVTGYTGSGTLPTAGSAGEIIISGKDNYLGNIYAGGLSEYGDANIWAGSSKVTISEGAGGTIGVAYAHGATEPRGTGDGGGMSPDSTKYAVTGDVTIGLSGSQPAVVYGTTGGESNAAVIITGGENLISNLPMYNVDSLTVAKGVVELAALNENVNLTIKSGAELDLSNVIADNGEAFEVGDFSGGGMLVMGQYDKLSITGTISGITELQTDTTGRPTDKSTSGIIEYSWPYIDVTNAVGDGSFIIEYYYTQNGTFDKVTDSETGNVAWMVTEILANLKPDSFDIPVNTYELTHDNWNYGFSVEAQFGIDDSEESEEYVGDIPLNITVSKDGADAIQAKGTYASFGYEYSVESLGFDTIFCDYGSVGYDIIFYTNQSVIQPGEYVFNISVVLSDDTTVTKTITLTVTGSHADSDSNGICDTCLGYMDGVGVKLAGHSLSLEGSIGVNFYMELASYVLADAEAYMQFTLGGKELAKVKVSEAVTKEMNEITYYVFKCGVPAKDMDTEITAQIFLSNGTESTVYRYTVNEYADYILENQVDYTEETISLVEAMVSYGDYTKAYFAGESLEATDEMNAVTTDTLIEYAGSASGTNADVYYGSSLLLRTEIVVRHYFTENVEGSTQSGDMWYVDTQGIPAHLLGDSIEATVGDIVVIYSPLSYAYAVLKNEAAADSLKNLVKAMYLYNQAALAYSGY